MKWCILDRRRRRKQAKPAKYVPPPKSLEQHWWEFVGKAEQAGFALGDCNAKESIDLAYSDRFRDVVARAQWDPATHEWRVDTDVHLLSRWVSVPGSNIKIPVPPSR